MKVERARANRAPMLLFHGHEGIGKTSLVMQLERPLAILTERGLPFGVSVDALSGVDSYEGVLAGLRDVYKDPGEYRTLVIDTLDAAEPLIFEHVCAEHRWKSVEAGAYGKGYVFAEDRWRQLLAALSAIRDKHGITVAMTSHTEVVRIDDPRAPSFTSYQPKLHKLARALVVDACDAVFFLAEDLRTVSDDRDRTRASAGAGRFLFTTRQPAFAAKNRFGMPEKIPFAADFNISNLTQYWHKEARA